MNNFRRRVSGGKKLIQTKLEITNSIVNSYLVSPTSTSGSISKPTSNGTTFFCELHIVANCTVYYDVIEVYSNGEEITVRSDSRNVNFNTTGKPIRSNKNTCSISNANFLDSVIVSDSLSGAFTHVYCAPYYLNTDIYWNNTSAVGTTYTCSINVAGTPVCYVTITKVSDTLVNYLASV